MDVATPTPQSEDTALAAGESGLPERAHPPWEEAPHAFREAVQDPTPAKSWSPERLAALRSLTAPSTTDLGTDQLLNWAMDVLFTGTGLETEQGSILLRDDATGKLVAAVTCHGASAVPEAHLLETNRSLVERAIKHREAVWGEFAGEESRLPEPGEPTRPPIRALLCAPLVDANSVHGLILLVTHTAVEAAGGEDLDFVAAVVNLTALHLSTRRLTGLLDTERQLREELQQSSAKDRAALGEKLAPRQLLPLLSEHFSRQTSKADVEGKPVSLFVPVSNMASGRSAEVVRSALAQVDGVTETDVSLDSKGATIRLQVQRASTQRLIQAVEAVGHEVPVSERTLQLEGDVDDWVVLEATLQQVPGVVEASIDEDRVAKLRVWDSSSVIAELQWVLSQEGLRVRSDPDAGEPGRAKLGVSHWRVRARWACVGAIALFGATLLERYKPLPSLPSQQLDYAKGLLAAAVVFWAGGSLYREALRSLLRSRLSFGVYVGLCAFAALLDGAAGTLQAPLMRGVEDPQGHFCVAALMVALVLFGRLQTEVSRQGSDTSVRQRIHGGERYVTKVVEDEEVVVPGHSIEVGDLVVVQPGDRIAVDGHVVSGESVVDESTVTGESMLADKSPGAEVVSGSVNRGARLLVEVARVRGDTVMSRIVRQFMRTRGTQLPFLPTSEAVGGYAVPGVLVLAAGTSLLWLVYGPKPNLSPALLYGVAVLIVGCPCTLGFAEPLIVAAAVLRAKKLGFLFKSPETVELSAGLTEVLLDKTGTLTLGYPEVVEITPARGRLRNAVLSLAASAVRYTDHPLTRAILRTANRDELPIATPEDTVATSRLQVSALVNGRRVEVSRWDWSRGELLEDTALQRAAQRFAQEGKAILTVRVEAELAAIIAVADPLKPTAQAAVEKLHRLGIKTAMVTGDSWVVAEHLGEKLGLSRVLAEAMPGRKTDETRRLQAEGELVAVVGDGFNDAPALAQAEVGIAMAGGEDLTVEAADILLLAADPLKVPEVIQLARRTTRAVRQSTVWAFLCHALALPVAVGVVPLYTPVHFGPELVLGAITLSSLLPLWHALRLCLFRPRA